MLIHIPPVHAAKAKGDSLVQIPNFLA